MKHAVVIAAVLVAFGCKDKSNPKPSQRPEAPKVEPKPGPEPVKTVAIGPADVRWKKHTIEDLAIEFDSFENVALRAGTSATGSFVKQTLGPVSVSIQYGPRQTVDTWRKAWARYETVSDSKLEFCDAEATKLVVEAKPPKNTGKTMPSPDNLPEIKAKFNPAEVDGKVIRKPGGTAGVPQRGPPTISRRRGLPGRIFTLVSFTHRDTPVAALWTVLTKDKDAMAEAQERFFSSFVCK